MASFIYNGYKTAALGGGVNLATDTLKVALFTSSHVPDQDAHIYFDDVSANEVAATGGYVAGGETVTGKTVTQDDTLNRGVFSADDTVTAALTTTYRYAILYKSTGTPSTSLLIALIDPGAESTTGGGEFRIAWNATTGIIATT